MIRESGENRPTMFLVASDESCRVCVWKRTESTATQHSSPRERYGGPEKGNKIRAPLQ